MYTSTSEVYIFHVFFYYRMQRHGIKCRPGCSKLTMSLVNLSLNFQKLISQICQYFLLKKCEKLLQCKSYSHFFQQKISKYWL